MIVLYIEGPWRQWSVWKCVERNGWRRNHWESCQWQCSPKLGQTKFVGLGPTAR